MKISRRHALASLVAAAVLGSPAAASAETIRVGLPTKTYWPTTIAETAVRQKLFEKERISAELTIYRHGAEAFEGMAAGDARTILEYSKELPPSLTAGWIVLDKSAEAMPVVVQKALNALYGATQFMRSNRDTTVKLIADLYEMPEEIAALEYENTILKLETDGNMAAVNVPAAVQLSLDLAKLGGFNDIVPTEDVISPRFKPVPTKT